MENDLELAKYKLEEKRLDGELRLKEAELAFKNKELEIKREGERRTKSFVFSPLTTAIIAGVFAVLGTFIGAYLQGRNNAELERQKFETALILKAIETGNSDTAANNLLFLVRAGFIQDPKGQIASLVKNPENSPVLPSNNVEFRGSNFKITEKPRIITEVVIVDSGSNEDAATYIQEIKSGVSRGSIHYIIDRDGKVNPVFPESVMTFHTVGKGHNQKSIGIMLAHQQGKEEYPEQQLSSLITLLVDISKRYKIDVQNIITAQEAAASSSGGSERITDLTKSIQRIRERVRAGLLK